MGACRSRLSSSDRYSPKAPSALRCRCNASPPLRGRDKESHTPPRSPLYRSQASFALRARGEPSSTLWSMTDLEIAVAAARAGAAIVADSFGRPVEAEYKGQKVGTLGDIAAFSLHPLKNLNTCGDGGIITTNLKDYHEKALLFRNHGLKNRNESEFFAYNFRLDSLKAAIANLQINDITKVTEKRNHTAQIYDSAFTGIPQIKIPERRTGVRQVFHTYIIQVANRNELMAFLENRGIETKIHYPIPIHLMEAAKP